jgi:tetratricopeptide (TPR) repeat protein
MPGWTRLEDVRKAAQEAKGRFVLTGTARNVKGIRRISVRLLDPASGKTLFATAFQQNEERGGSSRQNADWVRNVYKILNADDLPSVPADPGVHNEKANEALKSGRAWMDRYTVSGLDQAIIRFREAVAAEPRSSLAHSYLAAAATCRTHFVADWSYLELGKAEALKALALDPDSVFAHRALAGVYFQGGQFHEAQEELLRTIEIGGVDEKSVTLLGPVLDVLGRPDQALAWYQVASNLHKTPGEVEWSLGDTWAKLADDEKAFRAYDRATELQPASSQGALGRARLHLLRGEFEAARQICSSRLLNSELNEMSQMAAQIEFFARNYAAAEKLYSKLAKGDEQGGGSFYAAVSYQSALGRIKQTLGSTEVATRLLQESLAKESAILNRQPGNPEAAYRVAAVEASLNLTEPALKHLHQAIDLGWLDYRSLQKDPRFDSLRANPEFDTLIDGLSAKVAELRSNAKRR